MRTDCVRSFISEKCPWRCQSSSTRLASASRPFFPYITPGPWFCDSTQRIRRSHPEDPPRQTVADRPELPLDSASDSVFESPIPGLRNANRLTASLDVEIPFCFDFAALRPNHISE